MGFTGRPAAGVRRVRATLERGSDLPEDSAGRPDRAGQHRTSSERTESSPPVTEPRAMPGWRRVAMAAAASPAGLIVGILLGLPLPRTLLLGLLAAGAGVGVPTYLAARRRTERLRVIEREFPETLDLLCICVEAGLGLQAGLDHVCDHTAGQLALEWRRVLNEVRLGASLAASLSSLAERCPTPGVRHFVAAVNQAQELGLSMVPVLRSQADHAREARRLGISEQAHKIPIKVLFPLILCLLPALMIVVVGPAGLSIVDQLHAS